MKKPREPYKPYKPGDPLKRIQCNRRIYIQDTIKEICKHRSPKLSGISISLSELLAKMPQGVSYDDIKVVHFTDYDTYDGRTDYTFIEYYEEVDNPDYEKQLARYNNEIKAYEKKLEEYKPKYAKYKEDMIVYDEWYKNDIGEKQKRLKEQELKALKKRIAQLEKQNKKNK
jgi:hypothetical protein